jgi:hypothetical protein
MESSHLYNPVTLTILPSAALWLRGGNVSPVSWSRRYHPQCYCRYIRRLPRYRVNLALRLLLPCSSLQQLSSTFLGKFNKNYIIKHHRPCTALELQ